jgi:hypothetical protein
MVAFT